MSGVQKLCCVCGKDVASSKRVKDPRGRYYCEPCAKARQQQPVVAAAVGASAPPPLPATTASSGPAYAPATENELDLAPVQEHAPEVKAACARCKKLLSERLVRLVDGEFVCNACIAQQQKSKGGVKPAKAKVKVEEEEEDTGEPGYLDTIAGGLVVSLAILGLGFGVFFALYKFYPEPGIISVPIAAFLQCMFVAFSAGGLIVSMIVAARILGGISFGFLGPVMYKSIGFCLGLAVMGYFSSRFESMGMIVLAFRSVIVLVTLIVLFKIDAFEAILLTMVNGVLNFGLLILFGVLLLALGAMASHASDDDEELPHTGKAPMVQPAEKGPVAAPQPPAEKAAPDKP